MGKFQPLADAVRENLRHGDSVAMEGFTHLIPLPPRMRLSGKASATSR